MEFYLSQFMPLLSTFVFVIARLSGLVSSLPILSSRFINNRIKIALILMLSFIVTPTIEQVNIDLMSLDAVITIAVQIIIGVIIGLVFTVILNIFVLSGEIISMQAGLSMAVMNDPISNTSTPLISQLYFILVNMFFLVFDIPLQIISVLLKSFKTMPIGNSLPSRDIFENVAILGEYFYKMAFKIVLPIVVILFLLQIILGIVTKSAPQFNIFSVGFAIIILVSMLMIWGNLNGMQYHFNGLIDYAMYFVASFLEMPE